jgi:cyclic pyranopterin phosphate synthase
MMIDISDKPIVARTAVATGIIKLNLGTIDSIHKGKVKKGDVLTTARIAGINAVKSTSTIIPLCHPLPITAININFDIAKNFIKCYCEVKADYKTGVEMEALTGVTVALLTIWDMVKYLEKDERGEYPDTRISDIQVLLKQKD